MSIEINIPHFLQHLTGGMPTVQVEGRTVGECLDDLITRFPHLKPQIFDRHGKLQKHLDVLVNAEAGSEKGLKKPVIDGDKLTVINIISGG